MESSKIRTKFLEFFKAREHAIVPSSSLIPDDPSVLLTTAGMQQFKKYFTGELDFAKEYPEKIGAASVQKSFRTSDIDEVGDETHDTFFEMLGNFSFGGYFKKEAIAYAHEFITKEMGLPISYVTIFEGKESIGVPKDKKSKEIWKALGVKDIREEGMDDVFWGPTGSEGPCGPTTEIYCKNAAEQDVEIWNIVFNEYFFPGSRAELNGGLSTKKLEPLKTPGVDTGMGLERLAMISQNKSNIFETDVFESIISLLPNTLSLQWKRIFADHVRGIAFLISDGVRPSNKGAGYVLRRLMRRIITYEFLAGLSAEQRKIYVGDGESSDVNFNRIFLRVTEKYELREDLPRIIFSEEEKKFRRTLNNGLNELYSSKQVDSKFAFKLYESYGLPYEIIKELGGEKTRELNKQDFEKEFEKHQEISRAGSEAKFGGHGLILNTGELKAATEEEVKIVTRLHTATHLLQQALRDVLGSEVRQAGSDITAERTRFDFTFSRKLTQEELKQVEARVQSKIKEDLPVAYVELPRAEAEKTGALFFFKAKYGDVVKVYYMGKDLETAWSKEFCGGPHVQHTSEVGSFKIIKEEAVSVGVRRIRGIVE